EPGTEHDKEDTMPKSADRRPLTLTLAPDPRVLAAIEEGKELARQVQALQRRWDELAEEIIVADADDETFAAQHKAAGLDELCGVMVEIACVAIPGSSVGPVHEH